MLFNPIAEQYEGSAFVPFKYEFLSPLGIPNLSASVKVEGLSQNFKDVEALEG